jgi:opacity protein-like surface antigen
MSMKTLAPALLLCSLALPASLFGQAAELWVGGGSSILSNNGIGSLALDGNEDDVELKGGFRINFRLTLNPKTFFGHEVGYAYNRTQLAILGSPDQGMAIHQGLYNFLVYATPEGSRVRPFATGGGHFSNFVPPGSSATQGGGQTKFGFNYGAGVKMRVRGAWGFRLDFRQYMTGKPFDLPLASGLLRQNEISASVGFML